MVWFGFLEPPEIRPMAEEVQVVLHHSVVLPCEVQGFPRPTITWQREGVPVATGWFGCSLAVVIKIGLVTSVNDKTGNINNINWDSEIMCDTSAYIRRLSDKRSSIQYILWL